MNTQTMTVAEALKPFGALTLEEFMTFLQGVSERQGNTAVVVVPGWDDAVNQVHRLRQAMEQFKVPDNTGVKELEPLILQGRTEAREKLQTAVAHLVSPFGLKVTITEDKNWLETQRTTQAIRQLLKQVTNQEDMQSDSVRLAVAEVGMTEESILKAAAKELGSTLPPKKKGTASDRLAVVTALLTKLKGFNAKAHKPAKKEKAPSVPDSPEVAMVVSELKAMIEKSKDPAAVSDTEIEAMITRLSTEFSGKEQDIAERVINRRGRSGKDAVGKLRESLTATKRIVEQGSHKV